MKRRVLLRLSALLCLVLGSAHAQQFPDRPLTLIVPYSAGGPSDAVVRALGREVSKTSGQTVIVENRPGGATVIGTQAVLNQAADGYTLGIVGGSFVVAPRLLPEAPYNPQRDLAPISLLFSNPHVLVVAPHVPASDLKSFIAWAATARGTYSSFGVGSSGHVGFERFKVAAGIDLLHVHYKGAAPATMAVLTGEVDASFGDVGPVMPHILAGKLRAIAVAGAQRSFALPDTPTFTEAGLPGFVSQTWIGLVTKSSVTSERVARLNRLFSDALTQPSVQTVLQQFGLEARANTPEAFAAFIAQEDDNTADILRAANISAQKP